MSDLAVGTAQWGAAYGVTNTIGRLTDSGVKQIMAAATAAGIKEFDTAAAYQDAQLRLRPWASQLQITTKVSGADPQSILGQVADSLSALGCSKVHAVLLHDWDVLPGATQGKAVAELRKAQEANLVARVGVSVYDEVGLTRAAEAFADLGAVQVPANAIDRRLDASEVLTSLRAGGTQVQVRSAFLQGLLAAPSSTGLGLHPDVEEFHNAAAAAGQSGLELALAHVRALPWADTIIVGVTSPQELAEIIRVWDQVPAALAPTSLASFDLSLIDPRSWGEIPARLQP